MSGLVLSLFPGLDLLGRAFEAEGFCVVRGPDVIFGQDIRSFHPPAGRFDGVIGGPPCQCFSRLVNIVRANGNEPKFGNLIPEFERVVAEAAPAWWLMEEVPDAPVPRINGYQAESFILSPRMLGDPQSRPRRFTAAPSMRLMSRMPLVALEPAERYPAVCGNARHQPVAIGGSGKRKRPLPHSTRTKGPMDKTIQHGWMLMTITEAAERQGWPELAECLPGPWTMKGARQAIGNGVPAVMGRALARAIKEWQRGD